MQYILTEQEYEEIKEKANNFTKAQEYILNTIEEKVKYGYLYGHKGEKLLSFIDEYDVCFNNLSFVKLFELLGIRVEGNISMTFAND